MDRTLANMTERARADIGMTASDRAMALLRSEWADPDSHRNIMIYSYQAARIG
jgi:hypothetical protein